MERSTFLSSSSDPHATAQHPILPVPTEIYRPIREPGRRPPNGGKFDEFLERQREP